MEMADFPICEQVVDFFLLGDSPRLTLADLAWTSSEKHRVSQLHQLRFAFVIVRFFRKGEGLDRLRHCQPR